MSRHRWHVKFYSGGFRFIFYFSKRNKVVFVWKSSTLNSSLYKLMFTLPTFEHMKSYSDSHKIIMTYIKHAVDAFHGQYFQSCEQSTKNEDQTVQEFSKIKWSDSHGMYHLSKHLTNIKNKWDSSVKSTLVTLTSIWMSPFMQFPSFICIKFPTDQFPIYYGSPSTLPASITDIPKCIYIYT